MRRRTADILLTCGLVFCVLLFLERPAYAYVDPGSGLFLLQGISTAFLGILYALRRKLRLTKSSREKVSAEASEASSKS